MALRLGLRLNWWQHHLLVGVQGLAAFSAQSTGQFLMGQLYAALPHPNPFGTTTRGFLIDGGRFFDKQS